MIAKEIFEETGKVVFAKCEDRIEDSFTAGALSRGWIQDEEGLHGEGKTVTFHHPKKGELRYMGEHYLLENITGAEITCDNKASSWRKVSIMLSNSEVIPIGCDYATARTIAEWLQNGGKIHIRTVCVYEYQKA